MVNDKRKLAKKHYNKGLDLVWQKQDKQAIKEFKQAIKLYPELPGVHYDLGLCYEDKGKVLKAFKEYEKEIHINPDNVDAHNNLGRMYALQGGNEEAIKQFKLALKIDPNHQGAKKNLELAKGKRDFEDSFKIQEDTNQVASHPAVAGFPLRSNKSQVTEHKTSNQQPATISLCMMVKNEEECLPRCLESVKDLVDEIIIVDTGSTDKTVEIAKSYSAKVYYFKWCDDFSAARNETLKHPTKEWILSLDADEYIDEENKEKLIKLLQNPTHPAYFINIKNKMKKDETPYFSVNALERLYKNIPGLQYTGEIHNQIGPSLRKFGMLAKRTDIFIYHTGYVLSKEEAEKKYKRRNKILKKWHKKTPNDPYCSYYLATNYISVGKVNLGMKHLRKVINAPKVVSYIRSSAYFRLINCLNMKKLPDKAIEVCKRAFKLYPKKFIFHLAMVSSYRLKEDYKSAIKELNFALKKSSCLSEKDLLFVEFDPSIIHFQIADCHNHIDELDKALKTCQKAIKLAPDYPAPHLLMGNIYFRKSKYPDAINEYKKVIELEPETPTPQAFMNLGAAYMKQNELNSAIDAFKKTIDLAPDNVNAHTNLAVAYRKDGQPKEAIKEFETASKLKPTNIGPLKALEQGYLSKLQVTGYKSQEALKGLKSVYQRMAKIYKKPEKATVIFKLAEIYEKLKDYESAIQTYSKVIKIKSDFTPAHFNLGTLWLKSKNLKNAEQSFKQVISLDPDSAQAYNNLGFTYLLQKSYDNALQYLQKAVELNSSHILALKNLAICHKKLGNEDMAIALLARAKQIEVSRCQEVKVSRKQGAKAQSSKPDLRRLKC